MMGSIEFEKVREKEVQLPSGTVGGTQPVSKEGENTDEYRGNKSR